MSSTIAHATVNRRFLAPYAAAPGVRFDAVPRQSIGDHRALSFLPERDLSALMQWSAVRVLSRRAAIFRHGDPGSTVFSVLEGYVKMSTTLANGHEVTLDIIGPGGCVGVVAVLSRWPHEVDATALSRCRVLAIDGRQFRQVLDRRPEGLAAAMRLVSERLRRTTEQIVDAFILSGPERLAKLLMQLAGLRSPSPRGGDTVPLRLSQSELGSMTGLTRESVNKHLGTWRDAGWITLSSGSVTSIDVAALSSLLPEDHFT